MPVSRALTNGSGMPNSVAARMANTTMAGISDSRKSGLMVGMTKPIIR
jgi:hypothetical protein